METTNESATLLASNGSSPRIFPRISFKAVRHLNQMPEKFRFTLFLTECSLRLPESKRITFQWIRGPRTVTSPESKLVHRNQWIARFTHPLSMDVTLFRPSATGKASSGTNQAAHQNDNYLEKRAKLQILEISYLENSHRKTKCIGEAKFDLRTFTKCGSFGNSITITLPLTRCLDPLASVKLSVSCSKEEGKKECEMRAESPEEASKPRRTSSYGSSKGFSDRVSTENGTEASCRSFSQEKTTRLTDSKLSATSPPFFGKLLLSRSSIPRSPSSSESLAITPQCSRSLGKFRATTRLLRCFSSKFPDINVSRSVRTKSLNHVEDLVKPSAAEENEDPVSVMRSTNCYSSSSPSNSAVKDSPTMAKSQLPEAPAAFRHSEATAIMSARAKTGSFSQAPPSEELKSQKLRHEVLKLREELAQSEKKRLQQAYIARDKIAELRESNEKYSATVLSLQRKLAEERGQTIEKEAKIKVLP